MRKGRGYQKVTKPPGGYSGTLLCVLTPSEFPCYDKFAMRQESHKFRTGGKYHGTFKHFRMERGQKCGLCMRNGMWCIRQAGGKAGSMRQRMWGVRQTGRKTGSMRQCMWRIRQVNRELIRDVGGCLFLMAADLRMETVK